MHREDIYCKEGFEPLVEARAISVAHPDLATSGGILETKKIADYCREAGIPVALHQAGSPWLQWQMFIALQL
ncbi:MAG: hypothetical protein Ct9H90mP2_05880 [Dehalococcoidia bacterium]|nr:MAG: hypothetical protein Ct9H90mP2_05880 [Dehalococcoidia bacterium]